MNNHGRFNLHADLSDHILRGHLLDRLEAGAAGPGPGKEEVR
jgi:hypothetical protein